MPRADQTLFSALLLAALAGPGVVAAQTAPPPPAAPAAATLKAPAKLYHEPRSYLLLPMAGDRVRMRYTPGSLDRTANLQTRLELATRLFEKWTEQKPQITVYVLARREWEEARYEVAYGLPVRVGRNSVAAPAEGDEGTVQLWSELLEGVMPQIGGAPLRGTPEQVATMTLADFLAQLQAAEIVVDQEKLGGDAPWVRGLVTHLASLEAVRRFDEGRLADLDAMYAAFSRSHAPRSLAARDFTLDLPLGDWLWFQAQFHRGAKVILEKEGKGAMKEVKQLRKKGDGVLRGDLLLKRYKGLDAWFRETFSAVSLRGDH